MAAQRPNVIVFPEYANLTVTPDIPDLNVLIVGPCYQILDYLDDKTDCEAADYGTADTNNPFVDPTAVIIAAPPEIEAGAVLDSDSVKIFFDAGRAVVVKSADPAAADAAEYTIGDNLFLAHDTTGGVHFGREEVAPGDIIITQGTGTNDTIRTVKELAYTLHDFGGTLNFVTNGVQPGDTVILSSDGMAHPRDGEYTVLRVIDEAYLEVDPATCDWYGHVEAGQAAPADNITIEIVDPNGTPKVVSTTLLLADYCNLRTTSDFEETILQVALKQWRVERAISDVELDSTDFTVSGNQVTLDAAIKVDLSSTLTGKSVSFATAYMEYMALRTDLQEVTTLSNTAEILDTLGKYDARNPLCVGAMVAKYNTTTAINIYGVSANTTLAYSDFIDRISTVRDVYAIVPLTYSTTVLANLLVMANTLADPNEALTHGFKQKFRAIIGAVELETTKYMVDPKGGCTTSKKTATAPTGNHTFTLIQTGAGTPLNLQTVGILPGDIFEVTDIAPAPTTVSYTVAHVNTSTEFEVEETAVTIDLSGGGADFFRFTRAGVLVPGATKVVGTDGVTHVGGTAAALDDLFTILDCPTAGFISSGCMPGDYLELPANPTVNSFTTGMHIYEIDEVISNQRVRIVCTATNTSTVEYELPHYARRAAPGTLITQGTMFCRVRRDMTKTQQVTNMVAVAQSFGNKRMLLVYPDSVDVADLVDGSITRTDPTVPEPAVAQPGYYLACAVGGQTAGNPPQQGFTNMGIAGIPRVYNSSEYFSEQQLTDLSNGGVYVFMQDNASSLPYSIHELTTDVSVLEFSEYMVVKDFDFVAWTFLDTLLPFLGEWNVTDEAIEFIKQALYSTGDTLKSRIVAKIGPPLISYSLDSVAVSTLSPDRIDAYVQVELPMTLNTIALHLVA